ncbi:retrovirus-related pol polyprotein from transposon TNT 1-94 [Tanacetum coccineum]
MHNNIMAAGSRDRPPMLATGRYAQWRSRFLRYIDTRPNGDALRKCILKGPYTPTIVTTPAVPATEDSPAVPEQTTVETVTNMTPENRAHFESEKEAIHLILTRIGDEIYSTVDACQTAQEMWEAIERLQQVNVQFLQQLQPEWSRFVTIVKQQHKLDEVSYHKLFDILKQYQKEVNELRAERMAKNANPLALKDKEHAEKFCSHCKVYFKKRYKPTNNKPQYFHKHQKQEKWILLQGTEYDNLTGHLGIKGSCQHSVFSVNITDLLNHYFKQYQKEVNEIRAERIAKNANPLALVAAAQPYQDPYYQAPKSHKSYAPTSKASLPTRSHATTRHKGKEIAKPITPPSKSASEEDSDLEQAQKDKEMQKNLALIAKYFKKIYKPTNNNLRTSSNTKNKNVDTTPRYKNDNQTGQFGNQRTMTIAGARETVGGQVVQQSRIQCFNCKEFGHFAKECRKPKRIKDSTYHKEKMLLCKQAEKGVPLQAEQSDWLADTDEEIDEQELEAHYSYMAKIQEVPIADLGTDSEPLEQVQYDAGYNVFANETQHSKKPESTSNTCLVEQDDSNVIPDSPDMCDTDIQNDQNAVECDDECVALTNLIANLKHDVDENKKI